MARNSIYGRITAEQAKEHDDALLAAQIQLLNQVKNNNGYNAAKNYAEAYALISGLLAATPPVEVKNG
jgi:hypothetical protein